MKKTIFLSLLIIMATGQLHAQLMISISPPAPINLRSSALFNATLINSGSNITLYFKGSIINTVNGKKILEGKSISMDFAKGTHMLNEAKLQPVYSFYDESFRETGFAPYGNYEICLQAYVVSNNEEVGNGCTAVEVTPTSPPLLISPDNGSIIYEQYPLLTWLAPTPVQRYGSILYDLKLVEIMQNQTAYDAIQRNFAILDIKDLKSTFLQYPVTATKLDTSKQYVWKVLAKTATGNLIGETEVWKFRLQSLHEEEEVTIESPVYILLSVQINTQQIYQISKKKLFIKIQDRIETGKLLVRLTQNGGKDNRPKCIKETNVEGGIDLPFVFDLSECRLKSGSVYQVEILLNGRKLYNINVRND